MNKMIFCIIFGLFFGSCNNPKSSDRRYSLDADTASETISQNLSNLFWGVDNNVRPDTTNPLETAIYYLNKSMYNNAYYSLKNNYALDSVFTGGFYGFKSSGSYEPNSYKLYAFYRLNDYIGNMTGNTLSSQLMRSLVDSLQPLYSLQEVEYSYLNIKYNTSIEEAKALIPKLFELKKKKRNAMRLDYLLTSQYFIINDSVNALKLSDELIDKDYNALPVLRNAIRYLSLKNSSLLNKYIALLDKKFPAECNLIKANLLPATVKEDSVRYECTKCYQSAFQIDSIYARLALVRYYMQNRKIDKVESLVNEYLKNLDSEPYDEEGLYIKGAYYDLYLRTLFILGRYKEIRSFIETKLQHNPVVIIENNNNFKLYIQKLYVEYMSLDTKNFISFLEKNFSK